MWILELLLDQWQHLYLSSLLGDLDQLCLSSLCFGVWDLDRDFERFLLDWGGDQDLHFFFGGGGGSSFCFLFGADLLFIGGLAVTAQTTRR